MLRKAVLAAIGVIGVTASGLSSATSMLFNLAGQMLATQYVFTEDGGNVNVSVTYMLTAITSGTADFNVLLHNASTGSGQNRLVSFGVDTTSPSLTGATATASSPTAGEWDATLEVNSPSFCTIDLCSFAGPNCSGGGGNGIAQGGADESFHLQLTGDFGATPSLTFNSPFPGKFQSVGLAGQSFEVDACTPPSVCTPVPVPDEPPPSVPEPGTLALLGLGVLTLALRRRTSR